MWHSRGSWIVWIGLSLVLSLLFIFSAIKRDHEVRRFIGDRVSAAILIDNQVADSATIIRTGSGAYIVKLPTKEYLVERVDKKWVVGAWIIAGPSESRVPGAPKIALVFPPGGRTGDWEPNLKVETDLAGAPTRISFTTMDNRKVRIDLGRPWSK